MIPNTLDGEIFRRTLKKNYAAYVEYVNPGFYMSHFHKYLCDKVQEFVTMPPTGKALDILLLSVPPRHGKSYTVTETLPSWFMGINPARECIICSYDSDFAEGFNRRNRDKFNEYAYDIFKASANSKVQGVNTWETTEGGKCHAAGLKAGITGYGADLFILDDPIKNKNEAQSETILSKIISEMGPSVQSRIYNGGKLIIIQTRWVENDPIGFCLKNWSEYVWEYINLPCECEDETTDPLHRRNGDSLMGPHLGDYNIPAKMCNDNTWLQSKKKLTILADGEYTWNALYQGHPSAQNGNVFNDTWWQLYSRKNINFEDFEYTVLSVDATFKKTETSDMVSIQLWGMAQNHCYLYKLVNKRMGFVETLERIKKFTRDFPQLDNLLIEDKANGSAIIDTLRYSAGIPPIVPVNPLGGKYSRAQAVAPFVSSLAVHVPDDFTFDEEKEIEWDGNEMMDGTRKFIVQHTKFPFMAHDDMVDAETQALARLIKLITGEEPMPEKRYIRFTKWYPDMWEDYYSMNDLEQEKFIKTYGAPLEWAPDDYNSSY